MRQSSGRERVQTEELADMGMRLLRLKSKEQLYSFAFSAMSLLFLLQIPLYNEQERMSTNTLLLMAFIMGIMALITYMKSSFKE